jgi:hypothetical protein
MCEDRVSFDGVFVRVVYYRLVRMHQLLDPIKALQQKSSWICVVWKVCSSMTAPHAVWISGRWRHKSKVTDSRPFSLMA